MTVRSRPLALLLPLLLLVSAASAKDRKPYAPWVDPEAPTVDGKAVVWRGDQRHASRLPAVAGDAAHVYRIRNFRWNFVLETDGQNKDHWRPVFGEAVVDTSRIRGMSLLWYPFAPEILAGHTSLLIHFDPGAIQPGGELAGREDLGPEPTGIVVSLEALMKQGEKYGFKDGILGNFGIVYSVSTWENYVQRCIDVYQGALHRWPLELSEEEAVVVGRATLDAGLSDHSGETYWLTRNSCSTAVMDMLIDGLRRFQRIRRSEKRAEDLEILARTNENTKGVDVGQLMKAAEKWMLQQARETVTLTKTRKLLGIHRDRVRRESPFGIFVNPLMSFPAQLPGVLRRRGLIEDEDPTDLFEYKEPGAEEATGTENTRDPGFSGLAGSE